MAESSSLKQSWNKAHIAPEAATAIRRQSSHLNIALVIGGLSGLLFYAYTFLIHNVNPVPILGHYSLSRPSLLVAAAIIFGLFLLIFIGKADTAISPSRLGLAFNAVVLSLAVTIIGTALLAIFVVSMDSAFTGLYFDIVTASFLVAGSIAVTSYLAIRFAASITNQRIYLMLVIILFGGILVSAIAVNTPDWYDIYLSALGMASAGPVAKLFNFSLVFAGIMLIAMANVLFLAVRSFYVNNPRVGTVRFEILYGLFVGAGIFLAGIGLFPYVVDTTQGRIHQLSAGLLGVLFVLWMWFLRWLIPLFDNSFYYFSIAMGLGIALVFLLANLHIIFNTTGLEITVFVIATAWLSLFLSNMFNATITPEERP